MGEGAGPPEEARRDAAGAGPAADPGFEQAFAALVDDRREASGDVSRDVAAILASIILVVVISELFSAWLRTRISKAIA